ncbi:MAG TPA: terminase gpA endonuclease subunit [Chthoniobacteraceae bacterium]|nr:terminase gpA endonuclease subunit [Chthoniobacteraceae bacterium]
MAKMHVLEKARRSSYAPRDRRTLEQWAKGVKLPSAYAINGPFDLSISPWLRRQWEALDDPLVREVTCVAAVRTGKTLGADLFFAKEIATNSVPMMFNIGNEDDAKEHAKTRFLPLLRSIPSVCGKFTSNRHDVTDTMIRFIDGNYIIIQGLRNPNNFDSKGICNLVNDEPHKAPKGNISKAKSRTDDFRHKCKVLNISQGGEVNDDMDVLYRKGTMEVFGFKCPSCGQLQPFEWRDAAGEFRLKWDKDETTCPGGRWDYDAMAKTIRYECGNPECDKVFRDTPEDRREQTYDCGQYLPPANPIAPRDTASVNWNQLCVPWIPWREIVIDWIEAMEAMQLGDYTKLKNFIQRRLAQPYEETEIRIDGDDHEPESDYEIDDPWPDEAHRFMACDRQEKGGIHFVCGIRAFAQDGRSRLLWAGRLESYEDIHIKASEYGLSGPRVAIDSGHESAEVYAACAKYAWISFLGSDESSWGHPDPTGHGYIQKPVSRFKKVYVGIGTRQQAKNNFCYHFLWSNPYFKDVCHRRIFGKGIEWGVPAGITEVSKYIDPNSDPERPRYTSYWPQMRSNQKIIKRDKVTGAEKAVWTRIGNRHDHYLDVERMLLVHAFNAGCFGYEAGA